jgi:hypothetical protein
MTEKNADVTWGLNDTPAAPEEVTWGLNDRDAAQRDLPAGVRPAVGRGADDPRRLATPSAAWRTR